MGEAKSLREAKLNTWFGNESAWWKKIPISINSFDDDWIDIIEYLIVQQLGRKELMGAIWM